MAQLFDIDETTLVSKLFSKNFNIMITIVTGLTLAILIWKLSQKKIETNNHSDDDECMKFGMDDPLCEMKNLSNFSKTSDRKWILFLIPSLFTDHRIFNNQKKVFGDLIETIDLEKIEENSKLTLQSYAKQLAHQIITKYSSIETKENNAVEGFLVGGFCVGGMISILLAQELLTIAPPNFANKLKGILLIGSCPSFTHCVDPYYMKLKRIVMNYLPTRIFESIVKMYLWSNSAISAWMERSVLTSLWSQDRNVMEEYKSLLKSMMVEKDPEFVIQMLKAEFNFSAEEGQEDYVKWSIFSEHNIPISHIHGDHDYLIQSSLCEKTLSAINT
ncbi:hypothetical protein C9374_006764 [Naegleria lovaniensis]|uniref:Uncharacterized protein n=1 Tax=Naegleria lovaniensis TaxID=51637 RepID=A0AA88KH01_NAELO|nr:uncharacterized protein C9374_006764 [Naegleria lovaniensis]KAG2379647.1 hypothetical protein C9374_006764 [Naegleria lovaniensis]